MRTFTKDELQKILADHAEWLKDSTKGKRADLSNANLRDANLSYANLRDANLSYADLYNADLSNADLFNADLRNANLFNADLRNANLFNADLRNANLFNADLRNANLYNANLRYADLRDADLRDADLRNANLRYANLFNADLRDANLSDARLSPGALSSRQLSHFRIVPEVGTFTGYKKAEAGVVLRVVIPEYAKRLNSVGSRKCRSSEVFVQAAILPDGTEVREGTYKNPTHSVKVEYKVGEIASVADFCEDITVECAPGIHFFLTFEEAKAWGG